MEIEDLKCFREIPQHGDTLTSKTYEVIYLVHDSSDNSFIFAVYQVFLVYYNKPIYI